VHDRDDLDALPAGIGQPGREGHRTNLRDRAT
jgi:hypothetical protein